LSVQEVTIFYVEDRNKHGKVGTLRWARHTASCQLNLDARFYMRRWMYLVALLGLLVVARLYLDSQQNFELGCLGFEATEQLDCGKVVNSAAGTFLGISNIVWGALFYLTVALLSLARLFVAPALEMRLKQAVTGMVGVGVAYTSYLVYYQYAVLHAFCILCLLSALMVGTLAVLAYIDGKRIPPERKKHATSKPEKNEMRTYLLSTVLFVIVMVAQVVTAPSVTAQKKNVAGGKETVSAECMYDSNIPPVRDWYKLVGPDDIALGNPRARVGVIEFLDPNCPHCKHLHPYMQEVIKRYKDRVRFYIKPMPIWQISVPQIEAIYLAAEQGKAWEMLEKQFEYQQPGGLPPEKLIAIAQEIGLDVEAFKEGLASGKYRRKTLMNRQQAQAIGINSVPKVLINGKPLANRVGALTATCISHLIEQELGARKP